MADLRVLSGDNRATPRGKPGPDIEDVREERKNRRWDAEMIQLALSRTYKSRSAANKGEASGG